MRSPVIMYVCVRAVVALRPYSQAAGLELRSACIEKIRYQV
jgi:hypothetical protein